jgi:hypothetical protein
MFDFDLDRIFAEPDYPWLRISGTLSAVEEYLKLLDQYVPHISDQTLVRFLAEFKKKVAYTHPEDLETDLHRVKSLTEDLVPLFFHGAFVIALWAAFECAIIELADYARKKEGARLVLSDLREPNTRRRLELYLESVMRCKLTITSTLSEQIENLQLIRNCLAHANGDLTQQRDDRRKKIESLAAGSSGVSIRNGNVIVENHFAHLCMDAVIAYVNALLQQLHETYPLKLTEKAKANRLP